MLCKHTDSKFTAFVTKACIILNFKNNCDMYKSNVSRVQTTEIRPRELEGKKKKKRICWKPLKELPKSAGSKTAKYVKGSKILRKATTKVDLAEHENGLLTALPLVPLSLD